MNLVADHKPVQYTKVYTYKLVIKDKSIIYWRPEATYQLIRKHCLVIKWLTIKSNNKQWDSGLDMIDHPLHVKVFIILKLQSLYIRS